MQRFPQPPTPHRPPYPPGMRPPIAPLRSYGPPAPPPLPHPRPFPTLDQQGVGAYPHHLPAPNGTPWRPTVFAPIATQNAPRRKKAALYLAAASAVAAAVFAIVGFWAPGLFVTNVLAVTSVQADVARILSDPNGYGAKNVSDVTCNDGHNPTITKGGTFSCRATINHIAHQFLITFTDDAGSYEISAPKGTKI